jgi:hypothetical protein
VEKTSCGAWTASPQTATPASRKCDKANGLNAAKRASLPKKKDTSSGEAIVNSADSVSFNVTGGLELAAPR